MINPYDVLGRERLPIHPNSQYLKDRHVLVTGAGGSIGSELCRRLATMNIGQLSMLDRDESALHSVSMSISGMALLTEDTTVLGDVRDRQSMVNIFQRTKPEIVFHAAALKHQPLLERYPHEAIKVNVYGTENVVRAATYSGTKIFVNVSTDKAADPTCVLGASKRIAERIVAGYGVSGYTSVRFGNVFGSRGSAVEAFIWQIQNKKCVTITSPEMTRFFITKDEAVDLLIHSGSMNANGDVLIMDMGNPIQIDQLARNIANQLNLPAKISYTGIRPGEKTHEILSGKEELTLQTRHPLISRARVPFPANDRGMLDLESDDVELIRKQLIALANGGE